MAISSPAQRLWWNEPIHRIELTWIVIAFLWGLVMFFMMVYWHAVGLQNFSNETYRTTPEAFSAKTDAMIERYTVRQEANGFPVVRPPAGSDVYLLARIWMWWPNLELEKGQTYRIHMSSLDYQHGFSLQPVNINTQVHPGYENVITLTPTETGQFAIICNEYCGIGHHQMAGRIYVVDKQ
ncbi:MAG: cytochrome C oxidase subunit II [Gammaproteobacteria bacterium]|nr:cytochrome C oxidase subunit II [Gammaproteobacteria bacterium]